MKNPLVCLLHSFLFSLCSWGINSTALLVTQSDDVTITEGGTDQIQCCWNRNVTRCSINWWKENSSSYIKTLLVNNSQCENHESTQNVVCCSDWTISNLNISDSGTYICKVSIEIPALLQSVGNGTRVTVRARKQRGTSGVMLVVTQSHYLTVPEGGAVQIQCCWNRNLSRLTVTWQKEHSNIKYQSVLVTDGQFLETPSNLQCWAGALLQVAPL